MEFVQIADVHFDTPFKTISDRAGIGEERRLEQRKAFKKAIEFVQENKIEYLFICGDLYEQEYIRKSTIEYINNLFLNIPNTKIYMVPGNHDPFIKNSYYNNFKWASNVKIFSEKLEVIENENVDIYGYGFNDFFMEEYSQEINIKNKEKINILLTHGDLYNKSKYNPINIKKIEKFDYLGIGHLHKRDEYYPGSLISMGFDELGEHGFIYGKIIEKNKIIKKFIKADEREFVKKEFNISNIFSKEELIEKLNEINTENNLMEIILIGKENFEVDINMKLIQKNIIKIKNETKIEKNLEYNKNNLIGLSIKKANEKLQANEIDEKEFEEIIQTLKKVM